jgi:malonyl-CoA/methylmalonyl-CoA synthetase
MDTLFPWLGAPSDRPALRVADRVLTQQGLANACAHHVAMLAGHGAAPGDRIGVWTQPALETLVALVAHAAAGFVSVPLDPKLGVSELAHVLSDAAPRVCVGADAAAFAGSLAIALEPAPASALAPRPLDGKPALILYTSGTTGPPKGALITDRNIAANLDTLADAWAWTEQDVIVHALPMFHVHGLVLGVFGSLRRGGMLRWTPKFSPDELAAALRDHDPAVLFAVPTMYHRLCEAAAQAPAIGLALRGARMLVSGSAPLSVREHGWLEQLSGQRVIERYGLTETLINCSTRHDGDRRPGSVGPPLAGVELRLVDDARAPIEGTGEDASGEIAVRGPHVFAGYLNRDDATRAVLDADGWFYTGDVAVRAPDGQLRIIGRRSTDIIKCGGFKVGAGEVEAALLEHPAVSAAAVIGAPDADLGERIVAFVVARVPVEVAELERHVASRLSPHKRPREVRFLDELPRNAMGKVQKVRLRTL